MKTMILKFIKARNQRKNQLRLYLQRIQSYHVVWRNRQFKMTHQNSLFQKKSKRSDVSFAASLLHLCPSLPQCAILLPFATAAWRLLHLWDVCLSLALLHLKLPEPPILMFLCEWVSLQHLTRSANEFNYNCWCVLACGWCSFLCSVAVRGFVNSGHSCYQNAVLQALFSVDAFRRSSDVQCSAWEVTRQLCCVHAHLLFTSCL